MGFPGGSDSKESACSGGDLGSTPGLGRALGGGHGNPLQYPCLDNPYRLRSLGGYSPWGHKESSMTERLSTDLLERWGSHKPSICKKSRCLQSEIKWGVLCTTVFISWNCCNKLPQIGGRKQQKRKFSLLARSLKSSCRQGWFFLEVQRENLWHASPLASLLAILSIPWF